MGGNALKGIKTRRYQLVEYIEVQEEIRYILGVVAGLREGVDFYLVESYREKSDFGDCDVLIRKNDKPDWGVGLAKLFYPELLVKNSDIISFNIDELQVDFIMTKTALWHNAKLMFDYNGLGALLGRIARFLNLKYGQNGLECEMKEGQWKETCLISTDPMQILTGLGYSRERYENGFGTINDVFEFILSGKYASHSWFTRKEIAAPEIDITNLRPFEQIDTYLENMRVKTTLPRPTISQTDDIVKKEFCINLTSWRNAVQLKWNQNKLENEIFNGNHIKWFFEIDGPELGKMIVQWKNSFESAAERQNFVLSHSTLECLGHLKSILYNDSRTSN